MADKALQGIGNKHNDLPGRVIVGIMLTLLSIGYAIGLYWRLVSVVTDSTETMVSTRQVNQALIVMLAAGLGSLVFAIKAYLQHACDEHNFDRSFIPWYFFWVLQGSLLGLIVYFALMGGLLVATVGEGNNTLELNSWSLAALGALAGLFSKYAIEKLKKVFLVAFSIESTEEDKS